MKFVDRTNELERIAKAINAEKPALIVVYGRRRVGKSTLIRQALDDSKDIYFQADETQTAKQTLYGRSDCTIKLQPIDVKYIGEAMSLASSRLACLWQKTISL